MIYLSLDFSYRCITTLDNNYYVNTFCICRLTTQNGVSYNSNSCCDFTCWCGIIVSKCL